MTNSSETDVYIFLIQNIHCRAPFGSSKHWELSMPAFKIILIVGCSSLPQDVLDFFEFGKNWKFDDPPPLDLIWEKFEIGKILNFWDPPQKSISLKHLKL